APARGPRPPAPPRRRPGCALRGAAPPPAPGRSLPPSALGGPSLESARSRPDRRPSPPRPTRGGVRVPAGPLMARDAQGAGRGCSPPGPGRRSSWKREARSIGAGYASVLRGSQPLRGIRKLGKGRGCCLWSQTQS
ncbi:PREDICTED: basic proline-rich protein-like, partial [Chinchilla lanigera]|uniref:basic proline-rich protein-like n=1 Tax=Chinchilla lanigera TaxID=34839 RepID=UPI0006989836